jgi:cyclopropane fatty-acyl-phospholipid synthase-like methyltransferase
MSAAAPTRSATSYPKLDYDVWARSAPAEDLWAQVRRTVRGKPIPEQQIRMIVDTIVARLALRTSDTLLDLACGNGALAQLLFPFCGVYLGSDLSEYLISVAKRHFEAEPHRRFIQFGAAEHVVSEPEPARFTKALCYGSFAYFSESDAAAVLRGLYERFVGIERVFIGNLPDRHRVAAFYVDRKPSEEELADPASQIGVWRTRDEFARLARAAGWQVEFSMMPSDFFGSPYRYDVLLTRGRSP